MFSKIVVVLNELLESQRALRAAIDLARTYRAVLLDIGLHQHNFYLSRLWSSVYDLAQKASCCVPGVHGAHCPEAAEI